MTVLGIDPGTATTGYAVVCQSGQDPELIAAGVIRTPADQELPKRLQTIYQGVRELTAEYAPSAAAVEELFFSSNVRTAMTVGHARGVILLALADAGVAIHEYKPTEVKQAVTGYGAAGKAQMQEMVLLLLRLSEPLRPDDAADAAAIALCHLQTQRFINATARAQGGGRL